MVQSGPPDNTPNSALARLAVDVGRQHEPPLPHLPQQQVRLGQLPLPVLVLHQHRKDVAHADARLLRGHLGRGKETRGW